MQMKPADLGEGKVVKSAKAKSAIAAAAAITAAAEANNNFGERKTLGIRRRAGAVKALYDHEAEGAIVLWDPDNDHVEEELKITTDRPQKKGKSLAEILGIKKEEKKLVHVVVDPVLAKVLRPHQVEGVRFLYQCTTGQVHPEANG
jgi:DNA repair and recombination RAD54-like protein